MFAIKIDEDLEGVVEELLWEFDIDTSSNDAITRYFITYIINTLPEDIIYDIAKWGSGDTLVRESIFEHIKNKLRID